MCRYVRDSWRLSSHLSRCYHLSNRLYDGRNVVCVAMCVIVGRLSSHLSRCYHLSNRLYDGRNVVCVAMCVIVGVSVAI